MTETAPRTYPAPQVPTRNDYLASIHGNARALGLETRKGHDRDEYEAVLWFLIGRTSCVDASLYELDLVARAFAERAAGHFITKIVFEEVAPLPMTEEQAAAYEDEIIAMLAVA